MDTWKATLAAALVLPLASCQFEQRYDITGKYATSEVEQGEIESTIEASGVLRPYRQIEIGSEVSGRITAVHVLPNDRVHIGQVLASIDHTRFEARVAAATGKLSHARAELRKVNADVRETRRTLDRLLNLRKISKDRLPAEADIDIASAAHLRATGEELAARAAVNDAEANLESAQTELNKAEIRSPVNGVVLIRSVEPGQTISASLRSPLLFILAENPERLELEVLVDEADVQFVREGQPASFGVKTFPNRSFPAVVSKVHYASDAIRPQLSDAPAPTDAAVVTYKTLLAVDNTEGLLRPGMTATAGIVTDKIKDAVLIPEEALNFVPDEARFNSEAKRSLALALIPSLQDRWRCPKERGEALGCAWILSKGQPVLCVFKIGARDGDMVQAIQMTSLPQWNSIRYSPDAALYETAIRRRLTPGMQVLLNPH